MSGSIGVVNSCSVFRLEVTANHAFVSLRESLCYPIVRPSRGIPGLLSGHFPGTNGSFSANGGAWRTRHHKVSGVRIMRNRHFMRANVGSSIPALLALGATLLAGPVRAATVTNSAD